MTSKRSDFEIELDRMVPKFRRPVTREFRPFFTNHVFVYHPLEDAESDDEEFLRKWSKTSRPLLDESKIVRKKFTLWHVDERKRAAYVKHILARPLNDDVAFARAWFWIANQDPFVEHCKDQDAKLASFPKGTTERNIGDECAEWLWAAERLGLLMHYYGEYGVLEREQAEKIEKCHQIYDKPVRPTTGISLSNLARFRIRRYLEERGSVIFESDWLSEETSVKTHEIRLRISGMISAFEMELNNRLLPILPTHDKKKKSVEVTLTQECTKAGHNSLSRYLDNLKQTVNVIQVKCEAMPRKLALPMDKVREDLKAPILELSHQERVKFTQDEIDGYMDKLSGLVEKFLNVDELQKKPVLHGFSRLIHNEQIPKNATEAYLVERLKSARNNLIKLSKCPETIGCGPFCVEMNDVWVTLKQRAEEVILQCSHQIRETFHAYVVELHNEFQRFKRILNFRSMDPAVMLNNKAEVIKMCEEDIPKTVENLVNAYDRMHNLTQVTQFDPGEHEFLINLVSMRRTLPRHIADHNMFFQRRIHIFVHFVKTRAQEAAIQLRVINTFTNPAEVDDYLRQMITLKPLALSLLEDTLVLNKQEKVVNLPLTTLPAMELLAKYVDGLWSLFEWTQKFHEYQSQFFARKRVDAGVKECQTFVNRYVEVLAELNTTLEGHRAARHFIVQLKPIAFMADREGTIADQANFIIDFWTEAGRPVLGRS
ncbi:Protein DHC-4 [Aphelenchoides avenae]|nr:Protein DHC-4 [Aphelenchus avenae]